MNWRKTARDAGLLVAGLGWLPLYFVGAHVGPGWLSALSGAWLAGAWIWFCGRKLL